MKWSQSQLGRRAKSVSARQIARIESAKGITQVRDNTVDKLAKALQVDALVLSGAEPLPEELSNPVPTEALIDPNCLRALRDSRNLSRDKLANQSGVSARQIARIEGRDATVAVRPSTLQSLAKALDVELAVLKGEKPLPPSRPQSDDVRLNVRMGSATRLDYDLVSLRYEVTPKQIVDLAPLLFTMLAEGSLAWREDKVRPVTEALEQFQTLAAENPHLSFAGSEDGNLYEGYWIELLSIEQVDLLGVFVREHNELVRKHSELADFMEDSVDAVTPFADYMCEFVSDLDQAGVVSFDHDTVSQLSLGYRDDLYGVEPYRLCSEDLDRITGGSKQARWALASGDVRLSDIPRDLMTQEAKDQRVAWLEDRLSIETREANERWEKWGDGFTDDEL